MEAVIRRAIELQANAAPTGEGVTEGELVRIGQELGIPLPHLRQALVEIRGQGEPDQGVLASAFGAARVAVSRLVPMDTEQARDDLDDYFLRCEHRVVQRRRPGWVVYEHGSSFAAQMGRGLSRSKLINAPVVEISIEEADASHSYISLAADLSRARAGFAAGAALGGGGAGLGVAAALTVALAPPAAFLGLPAAAALGWGMRAGYHSMIEQTRVRLESVLDRLESGELLPASTSWKKRFGLSSL